MPDSVISLAGMAGNVYVPDISDTPEEMKPTISTGVSVNHAITLLIALFGGWIWHTLGIECPRSLQHRLRRARQSSAEGR